MKIGLCHKDIGSINRGGVCRLYKSLAIGLRLLGEDVFVISSRADWSPSGITVIAVNPEEDKLTYSQEIARILPALRLDVVECSSWGFELLSLLRSKERKVRVVVRGDLTAATLGAAQYAPFEKELLEKADSVICVSRFAREDIQQQYTVKAPHVVHNGVDTGTFKVLEEPPYELTTGYRLLLGEQRRERVSLSKNPLSLLSQGLQIVWVGKPTRMKGFDLLQRIITSSPPTFRFYLCMGHSIEEVNITVGTDPRVVLLQDLSDADYVALLNSADVALSTSRWEGFGLAPLEAMACGCPVVYWEGCAVLSEFICEGKDGLSFTTVEDCLRALRLSAKSQMGSFAVQRAETFSWSRNSNETLKIYKEVTGR